MDAGRNVADLLPTVATEDMCIPVAVTTITCASCGCSATYERVNCACGHFLGYPNVRRAESMRPALLANRDAARSAASTRGVEAEFDTLAVELGASVATLNVKPKILRNLSHSQSYRSYYQSLDDGSRGIAAEMHHGDRLAVDAKVHTGYHEHVLNIALSGDGSGLLNYGPVTISLRGVAIEDKASVLRENAFEFYARFDLGKIGAVEAPGWRSTWADRAMLGVAALEPLITPGLGAAALRRLVLLSGPTRHDDRYIEIHIYGELGWQSFEAVRLEAPTSTKQEKDDWREASDRLRSRGVAVHVGAV